MPALVITWLGIAVLLVMDLSLLRLSLTAFVPEKMRRIKLDDYRPLRYLWLSPLALIALSITNKITCSVNQLLEQITSISVRQQS